MAGGVGSRLWPISISDKPKQFQPLINGVSLLAYTYAKLAQTLNVDEIYIMVRAGMEDLARDSLPDITDKHIIVAPELHRNALPDVMWALNAVTDDPNEPILFKSVDHYIRNEADFGASLQACMDKWRSREPAFTLLAIRFATFNSNDGYCIADNSGSVLRFLEKPSQEEFESAAATHQAFRFPFIFITTQQTCLDVLSESSEEWADQAAQLLRADEASRELLRAAMPSMDMRKILMMPGQRLRVLPLDYDFIDVGRFEELYQLNEKDEHGNAIQGEVVLGTACQNSLIINQTDAPLVVMSADGLVIVQTSEGSLVTPFADAARIGDIYKDQIHPH